MTTGKDNDSRLYAPTDGVDFADDESIRAFAERAWRSAVDRWTGDQMTTSTTHGPTTTLTTRYTDALVYATAIHGTAVRKGTNITYMCHLLGVSALVLEAGGSEDEAIAGLLHDAVEDAGGMAREADIRARFGPRVAEIVLACSDSTDEEWKATVDYAERKDRYLKHLAASDDPGAVMVSIADKVHNARAIATDLHRYGSGVLEKFNGTPTQILSYYESCLAIGEAKDIPDQLLWPLRSAIAVIAEHVPGGSTVAEVPS